MGSCTVKMKSYLSGTNTDTSPTHIYSLNYSTSCTFCIKSHFVTRSIAVLHRSKLCCDANKQCSDSDTTVLDHISASMAPSLQNVRKESFSPSPPHWKQLTSDTLIFTEHMWNPLSAGLRHI